MICKKCGRKVKPTKPTHRCPECCTDMPLPDHDQITTLDAFEVGAIALIVALYTLYEIFKPLINN